MSEETLQPNTPAFKASVATQAILRHFESMAEGETVTWEQLRAISQTEDMTTLRGYVHTAIGRMQEDHQVVMGNVRGVGYQRLDDTGVVGASKQRFGKVVRAVNTTAKTAACADLANLDKDKKKELLTLQAQLGAVKLMASGGTRKKLELEVDKTHNEPLKIGNVMKLFGGKRDG